MTGLPSTACEPAPGPIMASRGASETAALVNIGSLNANLRENDERFLLRAFRTFSEAAASLEHSYGELQVEVGRLRHELGASRADLERSLEENRAIRAQLDRVLESLPCGVVVASQSGEITHLNPEAGNLLGPSVKASNAKFHLGELPPSLLELLERSRQATGEAEASLADENGRWLAARHAIVGEIDSGKGSSVFILQDVSERKRIEQAEQKFRREQALAEMSAVLAHEIRNPLGSLELFAGLLAESLADDKSRSQSRSDNSSESGSENKSRSENRRWIGHIQSGLRTLAATVNNVLHFHSLPEPELSPVDLGSLLDWAKEFFAPLAGQARLQLACEHTLAGVEMAADRHRLEQVLLNLVLNAIRATPEGGSIQLRGNQNREAIAITVADTGPGIPPQSLAKIFEPGFSTRPSGPGLGLAVCRKIVEQHGGTITVESRLGRGAMFTVHFRLHRTRGGGDR